jgi:hypothetical protein
MAPHDDYRHEMDRLSSEQVEAILRGRDQGDPVTGRALAVVGEIRQALLEDLPAGVAQRHLAAIAAARSGGRAATGQRSRVSSFGRRRLVVALAAALAVGAGAATALTLRDRPDQPRQPAPTDTPSSVDETGSPLGGGVPEEGVRSAPNAQGRPRSNHGQEVSDLARGTDLQGCEKGQAVSDRASEKAGKSLHRADNAGPCHRSDRTSGGSRASGRGTRASHGQQTEKEARGGGPPPGKGPPGGAGNGPPGPS